MEIIVDPRFCGPAESGNGGYTCGLIAQAMGAGAVEVTLRKPPPLERVLRVDPRGEAVAVLDGDELVAEARAAEVDLELPAPPSYDDAARAAEDYPGFAQHSFPTCFVCGPTRRDGDGLRIFAGPLGEDFFAAPWTPDGSLAGDDGFVRPEFVWASIDCPGAIAVGFPARGETLLGRFAVEVCSRPRPGERCVVAAWPLGEDGRKLYAGTALFGANGEAHAYGRATWIEPR